MSTNVRVTYSDGAVADNVADAATAVQIFAAYQQEVDHPCSSEGAVVPVAVSFTNA